MGGLIRVLAIGYFVTVVISKSVERCPLIPLKPPEQCLRRVSECWSPGERDVECPRRGVCCFNGCANVCGVPPPPAPPISPNCTTDFVTQTEDVPDEVCFDVPGLETCTTTTTSECEQDCDFVHEPETVTEVTTCCRTNKELVCVEDPCDPDGGSSEEVSVEEVVCKKREKVCYDVPEEVCNDDEIQECHDLVKEECKIVKKPAEQTIVNRQCSTRYEVKCKVVHREICNDFFNRVHPKLRHEILKKKHLLNNPICYSSPTKVCNQHPFDDCKNVTTVAVEYRDAEECGPVTEKICGTKIVPKCEYLDKRQCNEAEDVCETKNSSKTVFVKNNCLYVGKQCHFEDVEECEDHEERVEKLIPKKVCKNVCKPVTKSDCKQDEPTRDCRTVFKTVTYKVPVQKCEDFNYV